MVEVAGQEIADQKYVCSTLMQQSSTAQTFFHGRHEQQPPHMSRDSSHLQACCPCAAQPAALSNSAEDKAGSCHAIR